ncbi:iron-siderophore ABC transporter substrate-binding protein [Kineococcus sp. SYSU DK006]|uniref:iron-siderophore ABC transporter substrate-binding protein n=1 Tax=Kineococcus sp. SYSU DK006 TaxID=3383127 RepID=UPI003D7CDD34
MLLSRRAALAASAAAALSLSACGDDPTPGTGSTASGTPAAAGGFPVTIPTKFGDVTLEQAPQRVVALGWGDAETALALGVQPVGASDWLAFGGEGVGPWATGRYTSAPELIGTLEPSYEAIAALRPDLVLDVKSSGDEDRHAKLSAIAPTLGVPADGESYLTGLEDQVTMIAQALGKASAGQDLLDDIDAAFEQAAAAHPQWRDRTVTAAARTSEGWGAYVEGSERVQFMERLGFVQNPQVAALPVAEGGFTVDVSNEQLNLLDADALVAFPIYVPATAITADPLWTAIPAVAAGRALVLDEDVSSAYSLGSVLSVRYALDALVPQLERILPA